MDANGFPPNKGIDDSDPFDSVCENGSICTASEHSAACFAQHNDTKREERERQEQNKLFLHEVMSATSESEITHHVCEMESSEPCNQEMTQKGKIRASSFHNTSEFSLKWTRTVEWIRRPFLKCLLRVTHFAASKPKRTIVGVIVVSVFFLVLGLTTNFSFETDTDRVWTPNNSRPLNHGKWIDQKSGFPPLPRSVSLIIHANGQDVLGREGVRRVFLAIDEVLNLVEYDEICTKIHTKDKQGNPYCPITGVTNFWNQSKVIFDENVTSDKDAVEALSASLYPDGTYVDRSAIFGNARSDLHGNLIFAQSYTAHVHLPNQKDTKQFESLVIDGLLNVREQWKTEESNPFALELITARSEDDEFERGVAKDIPLVPLVFCVMAIFTSLIFFQKDKVQSRSLLGFGAVVSILLSMMSGFGLLFTCGVPFTTITQMLPFVMFGIGLDDAFIISGSFFRTNPLKSPVDRIHDMTDDVGHSIVLTTLTSAMAFCLGCISSIPAVRWLCLYAFPTILIDFVYQVTFFVAILVIDEARVQDSRRDCCFWISVHDDEADRVTNEEDEEDEMYEEELACSVVFHVDDTDDTSEEGENGCDASHNDLSEHAVHERPFVEWDVEMEGRPSYYETNGEESVEMTDSSFAELERKDEIVNVNEAMDETGQRWKETNGPTMQVADRFMEWYADKLLRPQVKVFVLVAFAALLGLCAWSTAQHKQEFKLTDILPKDSYVTDYVQAANAHSTRGTIAPRAYFRFVDQSDARIQEQMEQYINDLVHLNEISEQPFSFWLRDFRKFVESDPENMAPLSFNEQIGAFLSNPTYSKLHTRSISLDQNGTIIASSCELFMDNVDREDVRAQIDALKNQRQVSASQSLNAGRSQWAFFVFDQMFYIWELYIVSVDELILTTVVGVIAVSALALLLIPHWSAVLFVTPFIIVLYIDLLGFLQLVNVKINTMSYIGLVLSIGLLVDFIMHGLLRYYELPGDPTQKTKSMLTTMGSSVFIGGMSTFLGMLPLAFSSSQAIQTVFWNFFGLVLIGICHGLILLPVVLSIFGTKDCIQNTSSLGEDFNSPRRSSDTPTDTEDSSMFSLENIN